MDKLDNFECRSMTTCPEHETDCESLEGFKCMHIGNCDYCNNLETEECNNCKYNG